MSIERELSEELRKQLEETYNINLDIQTKVGEKTYWDLSKYFTKVIEQDKLLIPTDLVTMCCHRTDIESIKEEFNKQLNEFTKYESNEVCEQTDRDATLLESAIGHPCQYASKIIQQETPPSYN